ncbi:MAG: tRNA 2-thiouridine(34) synthase MnmA, partial [Candidatus Spechtbacteria bacterium]|nr:tRNA 2-thiouridine(34) synthase MnmA [Candidatus Spechtbacteria bacterium]
DLPVNVQASIRYRQEPQDAVLEKDKNGFMLKFAEPQRAITSGQSAVIYNGEEVLGGGIIV